ncbi:MAG: glycoside hydrolase family 2 [Bacteroidaceae bacterium]|nr:glycoside hydrolase family 2 [Bacteroidaceae bacterium]
MKTKNLFMLAVTLLFSVTAHAAEWQRLSANLMTPWGEQIDPTHVWEEYPRPQLVRPDWMNLNGVWGYFRRDNRIMLTYERLTNRFNQRILVPFGVESALSGIMHTDLGTVANSTLMYRRTFELSEAFKGKRTLLHFGAVDWRCVVFVNGEMVGQHDGGNDPFYFDITNYLKAEGEQELQVAVYDPSNRGGQPRGKQTINPGSIWYTSCSGIWQTVWLEPVNPSYIERYEVVPDASNGTVRIKVFANDSSCKFYLVARDGETIVASSDKVRVGEDVTLAIPEAKLWSPDSPFLYNLDIYLCADNCQECDRARGYFGIRTLTKGMIDGHPGFLLNGKPIFMFGPLDQGWWPDGLLTPPSYDAMIYDLQTIKNLGMNMVRKHIKAENDLWYEWCDRNGLIVWQDMPNGSEGGNLGTKEELQHIFYNESERIVTALKQHPSICVWIPYNESWGQDADGGAGHTMRGYLVVRNADADMGRLMNAASGWHDFQIGDITDAHSYPSPNGTGNPGNNRVNVCGEFGGITYLIDGHLWAGSDMVYTSVDNSDDYTERFNQYVSALQSLQLEKGLWGGVYTQITDVEQEVNGILTYDRKALKVNNEQLASIRREVERTIHQRLNGSRSVLKAGDISSTVYWRYTTDAPAEGWEQPSFDDSSWKRGAAGFGDISQPAAKTRTKWSTPEIWIRRTFQFTDLAAEDLQDLCLRLFYDEDTEVYINGVLAMSITGYNTSYQLFGISEAARQAIHLEGDNVIAIHTLQTGGGQYIDAGFSVRSFKDNSELIVEPMAVQVFPKPTNDGRRAYLYCYSKNNDDRLFYAYSYDGLTWYNLFEGNSVFGGTAGQPPVRHPFLFRLENEGQSTFHLVFGGNDDAPGLYHLTSSDLATWKPLDGLDMKIVDADVIAPEIAFDPVSKYYIYYWSSFARGQYSIQYSRSLDMQSFSRPASYFNPGYSATGLHTFRATDKFVALYTDPDEHGLCMANCSYLNPTRSRFADFTSVFEQPRLIMNPVVFESFDDNGWLLLGSENGAIKLFGTQKTNAADIKWWEFPTQIPHLPSGADGGKVLVVSREELSQLQKTLADGIPHVTSTLYNESNHSIYTLQGTHVSNMNRKGIYITRGKKVVVKN